MSEHFILAAALVILAIAGTMGDVTPAAPQVAQAPAVSVLP
jgi:hypothetical protein